MSISLVLVMAGLALFWVAMLGFLWRRSLVGMLVGVLFGWLSVVVAAVGFALARSDAGESQVGAVLILLAALVSGGIQPGPNPESERYNDLAPFLWCNDP